MSLSVGIVGLPNVGKSTLFNALAARRLAETAPRPFTTIEPHEAVVPVPDEKLKKLSELLNPETTVPATVTFIDIAGLVKGAHKGEGLGNQFLAKIREVDAVVHAVRVFKDEAVAHVQGKIEPKEDIEIVNLELELGGITGKPVIYVFNCSENELGTFKLEGYPGVNISAKLEEEMIDFSPEERKEYLRQLGIEESGLERLINKAYEILGLITFYTIKGGKELHAWSLKGGASALEAAGQVHTDFAKNFIKAEVVHVDELLKLGSWKEAREAGKLRLEGKDYPVRNGEVVEFKIGS